MYAILHKSIQQKFPRESAKCLLGHIPISSESITDGNSYVFRRSTEKTQSNGQKKTAMH